MVVEAVLISLKMRGATVQVLVERIENEGFLFANSN